MHFRILLLVMTLIGGLGTSLSAQVISSPQKPYVVVYFDGRAIEGAEIQKDHFFAHGRSQAHLDDQLIFPPNSQVRLIRNRQKLIHRKGSYIEFANGDILPGQVEGCGSANAGRCMPDYLLVRLSAPLMNHAGQRNSLIRVRAEDVTRVVAKMPEFASDKQATIRLRSGPSFEFRAIRWRRDEIQALTADGVRPIPIQDVAHLHLPLEERVRAMRSQTTEIGFDSGGFRATFQTVHGAWLTAQEERLRPTPHSTTWIQPAWSLDAITLSPEDIVEVLFLRLNEVPLASLPAETLEEKGFLGSRKWARNRNVRGGRLDSGDRDSPIGVGMHAYSAVAFLLPPEAEKFSSWLGLDRVVGKGGCAVASVYLNDRQGKPLWQSGFLRGGNAAVRVGPLSVGTHKRLVLVSDFGHEGRPAGADPFDIRDEVDWIDAIIETKPSASVAPKLEESFPFLNEWTLSEQDRTRLALVQAWHPHAGRWVYCLKSPAPPANASADSVQPVLLNSPGVHYDYYENYHGFALPDFDKLTPKASGTHPLITVPLPNVNANSTAQRYKSTLVIPRDGVYEFYLRSDDGSRLLINGKLVANNDGLHPAREVAGQVALRKGTVPIQVDYFNSGGTMELNLAWKVPGHARQTIPPAAYNLAKLAPAKGLNVAEAATPLEPITLKRSVEISSPNVWLSLHAGRDADGIGDFEIQVLVDGNPLSKTAQPALSTKSLEPMQVAIGAWSLGAYVGQTIELLVAITPVGHPGCEMPSLHIDRLEIGPATKTVPKQPLAKDLLGPWRLRGAQSKIIRDFHDGPLSGGDGIVRLAADGTVSMWLRLPSGDQKSAAGIVLNEKERMIFDYVNGDWVKDQARPSDDRKNLIVQDLANKDTWHLVFTRDESLPFSEHAGLWTLHAESSFVRNNVNSGPLAGGSGHLSIGPDGGFRIQLQYPPHEGSQNAQEFSTGQLIVDGENAFFDYDADTWTDDHAEWAADGKKLTLREKGNGENWKLVFLKQP